MEIVVFFVSMVPFLEERYDFFANRQGFFLYLAKAFVLGDVYRCAIFLKKMCNLRLTAFFFGIFRV
jgi:hypothetical protein